MSFITAIATIVGMILIGVFSIVIALVILWAVMTVIDTVFGLLR